MEIINEPEIIPETIVVSEENYQKDELEPQQQPSIIEQPEVQQVHKTYIVYKITRVEHFI